MHVSFDALSVPDSGIVVITLTDSLTLGPTAKELDRQAGSLITRALERGKYKGDKGETYLLHAPAGSDIETIILLGLGKETDITELVAQEAGGSLCDQVLALKSNDATLLVEGVSDVSLVAASVASGADLKSYRFNKYRTTLKENEGQTLEELRVLVGANDDAKTRFEVLRHINTGVFLARDFVTEPPNMLYPESYAQRIKEAFKDDNVTVHILHRKQLEKLGMGALLGVGQGSEQDSCVAVMEYHGNPDQKENPIAFVGKGVTFDTGGISIKPSAGMEDMKYDMGGSAVVVGTMKALATRKAKVNAVGLVGLVENMPSGNAQRPSDVVTSLSGQTIEVLNTDAEGRLVLADVLTYCQREYAPSRIIDLATLTGAIVIALGDQYAGLFSNDDTMSEQLSASGEVTKERLWRFPLRKEYDKLLDSPIADMQNISAGRGAGSITAAQFLQRFIENDTPWAHLDIAGMAWNKKDTALCPKGASAFGVRMLNAWVATNYEG